MNAVKKPANLAKSQKQLIRIFSKISNILKITNLAKTRICKVQKGKKKGKKKGKENRGCPLNTVST